MLNVSFNPSYRENSKFSQFSSAFHIHSTRILQDNDAGKLGFLVPD